MANRADVYVKNVLRENMDIHVIRRLEDGTNDLETAIATENEEMIHLPTPDVSLVINAPLGADTKDCPIYMKSDVDLSVSCSRTDSNWTIKIVPNNLPPEAPTSVTVDIGEKGP